MNAPYVIGIAGGSASGKSFLAAALAERLLPETSVLLPHDAYYLGAPGGIEPAAMNYDHPDALDTALCAEHLRKLRSFAAVEIPVYDFAAHQRTGQTRELPSARIVIVEGVLVLHEPALRTQMEMRIFIDTPGNVRFQRRLQRDMNERGRSEQSVCGQWEKSVMPMHERYVEPSREHAHLIVDGTSILDAEVRILAEMVHRAARLR